MTSFYDWYADLPVASPQVFGDQTDVPESGDWWNATYLLMWGSNVPVTRTPDAHWMAEARYKGQKVVVVSPDYADNTKFADTWLPAQPGTDGALAMAMGHVILKEFFVERRVPFFVDYVQRYTDLPFLVTLEERDGAYVPGEVPHRRRPRRATTEGAAWKTVLIDGRTGEPVVPNGSMGFRYTESGAGRWNLDLGGVAAQLTVLGRRGRARCCSRASTPSTARAACCAAGCRCAASAGRLVTTVFDLMLAQYGVHRDGLPGDWPTGYDDPAQPYTPAWQEPITSVPAEQVRAGGAGDGAATPRSPGPHHDHHGGRDLPVVPRRRHLPRGAGAAHAHRVDGPQRRRLGALRRPGEVPSGHRLGDDGDGDRLAAPAAPDDRHGVLVHAHRPVALRRLPRRRAHLAAGHAGISPGMHTIDTIALSARLGWMPSYPQFDRNPLDLADESPTRRGGTATSPARRGRVGCATAALRFAIEDPDAPENWPRCLTLWRANLLGSSAKGDEYFLRHLLGTHDNLQAEQTPPDRRPRDVTWRDGEPPRGKLDLLLSLDFRMTSSTLLSDVVLPAATWYEKHDLNTTDMHPFVHAFNPAIDPPFEARTDFDAFHTIARRFCELARTHLGRAPRRRRRAAAARHARRDRAARRPGARLAGRGGRGDPGEDDAELRGRRARLPGGRREDGRHRAADRPARA